MIWLGERSYIDGNNISIVYTCDQSNYSKNELRSRLRGGTILIHGGGNLGDLWPHHQQFRETIVTAFAQNRIVQLPQSVFFKDKANLKRAATVLDGHPDFTLLVRERQSFEFARKEFQTRCILCPDSAFILGALDRPSPPRREILWLSRTDAESRGDPLLPIDTEVERTDWLEEAELHLANQSTLEAYDSIARIRLNRGTRILSRGKIVITDRLHGHILSLLLGIPHILLDNNYGKVKSFYETWTKDFATARWANSSEEALQLARPYGSVAL